MPPDLIQYPAAILGMLGALLVTSRDPARRRAAFACWIVSNCGWIAFGLNVAAWAMIVQQGFYLWTSIRGWRNNRA